MLLLCCTEDVLSPRAERQVAVEHGIGLMQEVMSPGCEAGRKEQLLREFVQLRHAEDERFADLMKENTFLRQVSGGSVRRLSQGARRRRLTQRTHSLMVLTQGAHSQCSLIYKLHRIVF